MITGHVPTVRLPPDHADRHMAAAVPARGDVADRRDLDPAPPARRAATAAAGPPEPELGGPGTARDPGQSRDLMARLMSQGVIDPDDKACPDCSCPIARGWPLLTYGISRLKWISRRFPAPLSPARDCAGPCCW